MAETPSSRSVSTRRALIGGLGLGAAGLVAETVTAQRADATQGQPILAGVENTETGTTTLVNAVAQGLVVQSSTTAIIGVADSQFGVVGTSQQGTGVRAITSSDNLASSALEARNDGAGDGVNGTSTLKNGVYGVSKSSTATGVYGDNTSGGYGVVGHASASGVGVWANAPDGIALRTTGKLDVQDRSGTVRVPSGATSVKVNLAGVTAASMVIATVQRAGGFAVQAAVPAAGSFTIYINKAAASPNTVKVAYLVLN